MHHEPETVYLHLPLPPELGDKRFLLTDWEHGLNIYLIDDGRGCAESHRSVALNLVDIFSWHKNDEEKVRLFCAKIPSAVLNSALRSPVFQVGLLKAMRDLGNISHLDAYPILLAMLGELFDKGELTMLAMQVRLLPVGELAQYLLMLSDPVNADELSTAVRVGDMTSYFDIKNRIIADYG